MKISRACIWIALLLLSSTTTTTVTAALEGEEDASHLRGDNNNHNNSNNNNNSKKHRKLQADENGMYRVMVHVTGGNHDRVGQQLGGAPGCTMHYDFEDMDTFVATVDEEELEILENDPDVDEIEEDYKRYMQVVDTDYQVAAEKPGTVIEDRPLGDELPPPVSLSPLDFENIESLEEWNAKLTAAEEEQDNDGRLRRSRHLQNENNAGLYGLDTTQARSAWPYSKGAGIKVCVIDSGLDRNHNDFVTSRLDGYTPPGGLSWFQDGDGHGTHVTGTIAAAANNRGSIGVAPDVEVFVVRVFNNNGGFAYASGLVDAANRCVAGGARVINMSLGGGGRSTTEERGFQAIRNNGVIVVAAAGNDGNTAFSYPASYNGIISVAAVDRNNRVTSFSQRNSRVDISGPGLQVYSTFPGNRYRQLSGTSMASPHVAGVVALIWSFRPNASANAVENALLSTARDLGANGRDNTYGVGIAQARNALAAIKGSALNDDDLLENGGGGGGGGGGTPATPRPSPAPTPAPVPNGGGGGDENNDGRCQAGSTYFRADLRTDGSGWQTFIRLDVTDGRNVFRRGPFWSNQLYQYEYCLFDTLCYNFRISDSFRNGLSGDGAYRLVYGNDYIRVGSGNFGASQDTEVGVACDGRGGGGGTPATPPPTPAPTPRPTPSPTPAPVSSGGGGGLTSVVTVLLVTDNFPQETTIRLTDVTTNINVFYFTRGFQAASSYQMDRPVDPTHCYEVVVTDSAGDGLCCGYGQGGFRVWFDRVDQGTVRNFGSWARIRAGNC